ncbi:glycosyltransferase family 4 protein [uncultured Desulfosarcina sp.]|uniref:glycosyltransferase family 4 protein n=1 Tax=uncultured Desulfosarcina sp. TaxID=218289 RepID=UPI0029C657E1|nr:glycosyltransferase family 4 protein [uncultured Desulfosarcina sp.]
MNICLINHDFIPVRGSGQTVYAEKIARGLATDNNVTVVTARRRGLPEIEYIDNIRVIRLPVLRHDPSQWIAFGYIAGSFIKRHPCRNNFDIIHFLDGHLGYTAPDGFVATLHQSFNQRLKGRSGIPYHSSFWNLVQRYPYYQVSKMLEAKALGKARACLAISHATRNEFIENYRVDPNRIDVVYSGIDTDFFKPVDAGHQRKKLGLKNEKVLLYVGFSTPRKGLEDLAAALHRLRTDNVKLVMAGKWEKGYRQFFLRRLGGKADQVIEAGYVDDAQMPALYSLADVFVLPSLLEGFGFPLVEAMACGTPIISTNAGAIPEVVGNCGIVIPPRNHEILAEKIDLLLSNESLRNTFQKRSRDWVLQNFSETVMIRKTLSFYEKTMPDRSAQ